LPHWPLPILLWTGSIELQIPKAFDTARLQLSAVLIVPVSETF